MHFVETPRLRFHYRTQGRPDGMPVLFVHGSFASARWWEPVLSVMPDDFYCVALDLRGCGETDKPDTGYEIASQAKDVASFADALGLVGFDLVAHSSGGAVAVEYALTQPDRARSLVLVDTVPVEGAYTPLEALALLAQMQQDRVLLRNALASLMPRLAASADPFFENLVADAAAMAPAAFTEVAIALGQWNRFADARALTLPCLLIWGDADPIVGREAMTRTLIAIPGANNLEVLKGVGHSPLIDAPLALAERIVDFICDDFESFASVRDRAF